MAYKYILNGGMMKKSDIKKKRNVVEEDEESEHIDPSYIGLIVSISALCVLILALTGKASIEMYKAGSILEATAMFIAGIMGDLAFITFLLMLSGLYNQMNYTMYPLIGLLIIEVILVLIGLV